MSPIEERAYSRYADGECCPRDCENCEFRTDCTEVDYVQAYIDGAWAEHELLTKWHDPKEDLPPKDINSGVSYLLKIEDEDGDIMYRVGARMPDSNKFIYGGTGHNTTVLGWREIHE